MEIIISRFFLKGKQKKPTIKYGYGLNLIFKGQCNNQNYSLCGFNFKIVVFSQQRYLRWVPTQEIFG